MRLKVLAVSANGKSSLLSCKSWISLWAIAEFSITARRKAEKTQSREMQKKLLFEELAHKRTWRAHHPSMSQASKAARRTVATAVAMVAAPSSREPFGNVNGTDTEGKEVLLSLVNGTSHTESKDESIERTTKRRGWTRPSSRGDRAHTRVAKAA